MYFLEQYLLGEVVLHASPKSLSCAFFCFYLSLLASERCPEVPYLVSNSFSRGTCICCIGPGLICTHLYHAHRYVLILLRYSNASHMHIISGSILLSCILVQRFWVCRARQNVQAPGAFITSLMVRHFYFYACAEEPNQKPHKDIFLKACKLADCKPEETIMVGDNLKTDIQVSCFDWYSVPKHLQVHCSYSFACFKKNRFLG